MCDFGETSIGVVSNDEWASDEPDTAAPPPIAAIAPINA
jgi:hypothetical protein